MLCSKFNWLGMRFKLMNGLNLLRNVFVRLGKVHVTPELFIKNKTEWLQNRVSLPSAHVVDFFMICLMRMRYDDRSITFFSSVSTGT